MKQTKWMFLALFLILALVSFGCGSKTPETPPADTEPAATEEPATAEPTDNGSEALSLVGEVGYPPISYVENGEVSGISPDIIREVFKRMGVEVKLDLVPWKRCQEMVKSGEADGFFSPYKTAERENDYSFTDPILVEKNVFVVKKDANIDFTGDIAQLKDYTVGTIQGYSTLEEYAKNGTLPKVDYSENTEGALKKLTAAGNALDVFVNTNYIVWYEAKKLGVDKDIKELSTPLVENPSHVAFTKTKDMSEYVTKFNEELKKMKEDGSYDQIVEKYVGKQ